MMKTVRSNNNDRGATLVELVTVVAILSIIVPVLGAAAVMTWKASAAAMRSASLSVERSLLSTHFTTDVAQASEVIEGGAPCSAPKDPLEQVIVSFNSPEGQISYVLAGKRPELEGPDSTILVRVDCTTVPTIETVVGAIKAGAEVELVCSSSVSGDLCRTVKVTVPHFDGVSTLSAVRRLS